MLVELVIYFCEFHNTIHNELPYRIKSIDYSNRIFLSYKIFE
jgi:hypothetical protein